MKKWLFALSFASLLFLLSACGEAVSPQVESGGPSGAPGAISQSAPTASSVSDASIASASSESMETAPSSSDPVIQADPDSDAPPASSAATSYEEPPSVYLGDFYVQIVDKNGLPVVNALVSNSLKESGYADIDWRSNGDGMAYIMHTYTGDPWGLFDYGDECDFSVTVPMPQGVDDVKQGFVVTLSKEALDAGIVFQLDQYDAAAELSVEPTLVITVIYENGNPAKNIFIRMRPSRYLQQDPDSGTYNPSYDVYGYTNQDGKLFLYDLLVDEYAIGMKKDNHGGAGTGTVEIDGSGQEVTLTTTAPPDEE